MTTPSTGLPNIRVVIREADDANLTLDVPNLVVKVEKNSDYNVNVTPAVIKTLRTGSFNTIAQLALTAISASYVNQAATSISSSYATTASYAINAGQGAGFPFSGSAVITGSLLITSSTSGPSLTVYGSDIYVRGVRIGAGPNGAISAENNIVFGNDALERLTTGVYNTAIGHETLRSNTVGTDNTAIGYHALSSSYSGSSNVGVGAFSLNRNTTGSQNVAIGPATMYYNRTGVGNTAVGAFAQLHDDTGSYNTSIGVQSFEYAHGDSNTMLGAQAGRYVTGSYNTYLGRFNGNQNGYDFRTGSNFIVISDGQSKIRAYYDGNENKWVWNADGTATAELTSTELSVNVPVVATGFTGSLYGTASVADGIDVIFAGVYESGSGSYIIPTPSGGLSYITSASYALTASYAMNGGGGITNTGSFATTGSNVFVANQTVTGSLYISQNLYVQGSSSISYVSQSTLNIGTNVITVNVQNPSTRFGGLSVIDSGSSPQRSGSLFFDSVNDQWIFIHQNQTNPTSSILIMGPQTYNNIGNETSLTTNVIPKSINAEHIGDSQISDNGTTVSITNGLSVGTSITATSITASVSGALTGTFPYASLTGRPTGLVSSSFQINTGSFSGSITTASYAVTASYALNASATLPVGTVSSSTQISTLGFVTSSGTASFATTASNTFSGNQTITGSLLTNADTLIFSGSMYTSGSVSVTGSLQATHFILPTVAPTTPQTGSMYFSGSFIYVYTGTQYRSASLV